MKKILFLFVLSLVTFLLSYSVVFADNQSEIIQRVDSDIQVGNNLLSEMEANQNDPDAVLAVLIRDIPSVTQHWNESSNFYESKISTETDEQLKVILININNDIKGLSSSLLTVQDAIEDGDVDVYTSAFEQYDRSIESLNAHIETLNSHFGVADYSWLAWPFWVSLIISITLFIMSRGSPLLPAEQLRNQFEFALFKSSLWPLGGSAISYFWYLLTPPGETFYILYGPIGVGYFQFFRGLYSYIRYSRPAINLAKQQEQQKLEALLTSEHFQKESLKEKAVEIGRLSPVIKVGK